MFIRTHSRAYNSRGLSLVEMMISVIIFSLIGLTVAYLVLVSARASYDTSRLIRSEAKVRTIVDNIRKETLVGEFLSVQVKENGRMVQYYNPVSKTTEDIRLLGKKLVFRDDINGSQTKLFEGVKDVEFFLVQDDTMLEFEVTANTTDSRYRDRPITMRDRVLLRNSPKDPIW